MPRLFFAKIAAPLHGQFRYSRRKA